MQRYSNYSFRWKKCDLGRKSIFEQEKHQKLPFDWRNQSGFSLLRCFKRKFKYLQTHSKSYWKFVLWVDQCSQSSYIKYDNFMSRWCNTTEDKAVYIFLGGTGRGVRTTRNCCLSGFTDRTVLGQETLQRNAKGRQPVIGLDACGQTVIKMPLMRSLLCCVCVHAWVSVYVCVCIRVYINVNDFVSACVVWSVRALVFFPILLWHVLHLDYK